jgi:DNA-directed RNA polymerase specialized sigma subunit
MNVSNTAETDTDALDDVDVLRNSSVAELRYIIIRNLLDNHLTRKTCSKVLNMSLSGISRLISKYKDGF